VDGGQRAPVAGQRRAQLLGHPDHPGGDRQLADQFLDQALLDPDRAVGVQLQHLAGDGGRDVRVAVPVATHPAAQHQRAGGVGQREAGGARLALQLAEQVGHRVAASCSMYQPMARASSATVGLPGRSSSVCHSSSTRRGEPDRRRPPRPARRRPGAGSPAPTAANASVGCAVNTGRSSAGRGRRLTSSRLGATPTAARSGAAAPGPPVYGGAGGAARRCWPAGRTARTARASHTAVPESRPRGGRRSRRRHRSRLAAARLLAHPLHQLQQFRAAVQCDRLAEHRGQPADVGAQGVVASCSDSDSGTVMRGPPA
jgi:hypothetical protein